MSALQRLIGATKVETHGLLSRNYVVERALADLHGYNVWVYARVWTVFSCTMDIWLTTHPNPGWEFMEESDKHREGLSFLFKYNMLRGESLHLPNKFEFNKLVLLRTFS